MSTTLPFCIFLAGAAGTGKTTLAKAWVKEKIAAGHPWCMLDKDTIGRHLGPRLLQALGADPRDRDSPTYKTEVRDLEYHTALDLAAEQLELGLNVVLPAPWSSLLKAPVLPDAIELGLPPCKVAFAYLALDEQARYARIIERNHPQDAWKLTHWNEYMAQSPTLDLGDRPVLVLNAAQPPGELLEQLRQQFPTP